MAHGYFRFVRALVLIAVLLGSTAVHPTPTAAQYMYLDANGDGIHTDADVVPVSGTVTFDVWLVTDQDRDGRQAKCAQDPQSPLTVNSYEFVLRAVNGRMAWTGFTNHMESATTSFGEEMSDREYHNGMGGGTILPPGRYRLASVEATILRGTPEIQIVDHGGTLPGYQTTSFGCQCLGFDFDNTMKLGQEWQDADGLPWPGVANVGPTLDPIADMTVSEGANQTQTVHASDPEGDPLGFIKQSGPAFMTVATTDSGTGITTATITLAPDFFKAGNHTGAVQVTDGALEAARSFAIHVLNVNRPPQVTPPQDMTVNAGSTAEQYIDTGDFDGDPITVTKLTGPAFFTIGWRPEFYPWILRVSPAAEEGGTHAASIRASDGIDVVDRSFTIYVIGTNHPPVPGPIDPIVMTEGEVVSRPLTASDSDGEAVTFTRVSGPAFVAVSTVDPGTGSAVGSLDALPTFDDAGSYTAVVRLQDGRSSLDVSVAVSVAEGYPGDTSWRIGTLDASEGHILRATRLDGSFTANQALSKSTLSVTFRPYPDPPDFPIFSAGATVALSSEAASRAETTSGAESRWSIQMQAPVGQVLAAGSYTNAQPTSTDLLPGLLLIRNGIVYASEPGGSFVIHQLGFGTQNSVVSLWATFEIPIFGGVGTYRGDVRYRASTLPISMATRSSPVAFVGEVLEVPVEAIAAAPPVSWSVSGLPGGALFEPGVAGTATLRWTPGFDDVGKRTVRFHAESAGGDTASVSSTIRVVTRYPIVAPLEGNRLHTIVSNLGAIADLRPGADNAPVFTHVNATIVPAATSAGIWLGALVGEDLRLAIGEGNGEFVPGPMSNRGSSAPDPRFKNYRIRAGHPEDLDWAEWPATQGAPEDAFGNPGLLGDEMVWSVYNDADPLAHTDPLGGTAPLGVEVRQSSFARLAPGAEENAVHLRYRLTNQSPQAWTGAYFSFAFFPQFWEAAGHVGVQFNDFAGCDTTLGMAYAYSQQERLVSDGGPPGAVGVMLVEGPKVEGGGVTDTLGVSSCRMPGCGPANAAQSYDVLQGLSPGGAPLHEFGDPSGPVTRFEYTGDPVRGEGWIDPYPVTCFPERMFLTTGPFTLPTGESQELEFVVLYARGPDRLGSVFALRQAARELRGFFPGPNTMPAYIEPPDVAPGVEGEALAIDLQGFDMDGDDLYITAYTLPPGAVIRMTSKQTARLEWTPPYGAEGAYPLQVVVTDGRGPSYEAPMIITVARGNHPPVADAGGGYCSFSDGTYFDGSASYDPEGDPLTFHWDFGDGQAADSVSVWHLYAENRDYAVSLTVSDPSHSSTTDVAVSSCVPMAAEGIEAVPAGVLRLDSRNTHFRFRIRFTGDGAPGLEPDLSAFSLHRVTPAPPRDRAETVLSADAQASAWVTPGTVPGDLDLAFRLDDLRGLLADFSTGLTEARLRLGGRRVNEAAFEVEFTLSVDAGRRPLEIGVAPNPFNPVGTISFRTTRPGRARITVHDPSGRRVAILLDEKWLPAGYHDVSLDTRASRGRPLPSGVYFLKISAAEGESRGRFVILK